MATGSHGNQRYGFFVGLEEERERERERETETERVKGEGGDKYLGEKNTKSGKLQK